MPGVLDRAGTHDRRPSRGRHWLSLGTACLGLLAASHACAAPAAPRLDDILTQPAVWKNGSEEFMLRFAPLKFNFVSERVVARSVDPALTILGLRVWEALAYFDKGAVQRFELSLYNRGDAGELGEQAFEQLVRQAQAMLVKWGGPGRSGDGAAGRDTQTTRRHLWAKPPCAAELTWAFTAPRRQGAVAQAFRADFVRLSLAYTAQGGLAGMSAVQPAAEQRGAVTGYTLRQRARRDSDGNVAIAGIPMVDQGQKGYCAAATAERMLRYYGRGVDQHVVAQLADTARVSGTSTEGMLSALRAVGRTYQLDVRSIYDVDYRDLTRMIDDYNRLAAAQGLPAIVVGRTIDIGAVFGAMNASVLKQARVKRKSDRAAFFRHVQTYVDAGVPLIWACIVGKFPENPPIAAQGAFGHIRLITGYNTRDEQIFYTDSWGPGHERKLLPLDDAWAMTFGLHLIKPRDIR